MSVSRVRENRMHGLTGGGWKRGNLRHRASPLPSEERVCLGSPVGVALPSV